MCATAPGPCRASRKEKKKNNKINSPQCQPKLQQAGFYVNLLILSMFGCCVTLISEQHHKGHSLLMQTNTPSLNFFGDESLFIAVNERHGAQLFLRL